MNNSIFAGIVTFNPDISRLKENINSIFNQVDKIVIVDNHSNNLAEIMELCKKFNIVLITFSDNLGIATALNKIMNYALEAGVKYVLTLDQDSICPKNMIANLSKHFKDDVAIVCPYIHDLNSNNDISNRKTQNVDRCITSGALTSVDSWKKIDGFDEYMFIDGVDFDFCDRLKNAGFSIIRCADVVLEHEIGKISIRKFLWFDVCVRNHSAFRKYYIARNIIYLDKKNHYKFYPIKTILREIKLILIVILYEEDKKNKLKLILDGIKDGFEHKIK